MKKYFLFLFVFTEIFSFRAQQTPEKKFLLSDWMSQTLDLSKTLKDITLPGAHDASIYRCFDCTIGANVKNAQTQYLPIENLLDSGIRYFDLRPIWDEQQFFTGHYTQYSKRPSFGCKGDTMRRILLRVNDFLEKHKELVVLHFSHYCDRTWKKENKNFLPGLLKLFEECLGDKIFVMKNDSSKKLSEIKLNEFLKGKKGKVILLINDYKGNPVTNKSKGFFSTSKDIRLFDKYSNTTDVNYMIPNQKEKFIGWSKNDSLKREDLFLMAWTLTQNAKAAKRCAGLKLPGQKCISIMKMAEDAKPKLEKQLKDWKNEGVISRTKKPNLIMVDITDGLLTRICIWLNSF